MAQKNGQTELAENLEGGVSTEKALLDIKRGMMMNLFHEAIGVSTSATPKHVSGIDVFTGTGIVAFDRMTYLPGKDYKPVAEGKETMVAHVGNVDTIQIPIDQMWYFKVEMMNTDLTRMKQQGIYRAQIIGQRTKTLATALDCEFIDMLIAAAAGQKDTLIQVKFPEIDYFKPTTFNYYKLFSDIGTELETKITPYIIGMNRREIYSLIDPLKYTERISHYKGEAILIEKILGYIQHEQMDTSKLSNITIIRHPFLNNHITSQVSTSFRDYDFRGVRAIFYFEGAPFIFPVFAENGGIPSQDTGNYVTGHKVMYAKGLIYGDMLRVITDPSTKDKPLAFEKRLVENAAVYNSHYGLKDHKIVIPDTVEKLQKNYRRIG